MRVFLEIRILRKVPLELKTFKNIGSLMMETLQFVSIVTSYIMANAGMKASLNVMDVENLDIWSETAMEIEMHIG